MFYFSLGYNEVNAPISLVKDLLIVIGFVVVVFKIQLSIVVSVLICLGAVVGFTILGFILKHTGMSDFSVKVSNSVNPELKLINKIADKLGVDRND